MGTASNNTTKFAGIFRAFDYAYGCSGSNKPGPLTVGIGTTASGAATLTLNYSYTTLPDSTQLFPLATNCTINVGSGSNAETVTPSAVGNATFNAGQLTCTVTATFSNAHGLGDQISSATFGLREACVAAGAIGGGTVVVDAVWAAAGGTTAMITAANALAIANVIILDNRTGYTGFSYLTASGTLNNTAVKALHSAPSLILAAQGAGTIIIPDTVVLENINGGTAYANGGAIAAAYGVAGTVLATGTVAATFLTSPTVSEIAVLRAATADVGTSTNTLNVGLYLAAATADFITGTGTMKWSLQYHVVSGL